MHLGRSRLLLIRVQRIMHWLGVGVLWAVFTEKLWETAS